MQAAIEVFEAVLIGLAGEIRRPQYHLDDSHLSLRPFGSLVYRYYCERLI